MLWFLWLLACSDGNNAGVERVAAEHERVKHAAEAEIEAIAKTVAPYVDGTLKVPGARRVHLRASYGQTCTLLVDTSDPQGCTPMETCRATLLVKKAGAWSLGGMGPAPSLTLPVHCPIGLLSPSELRALPDAEGSPAADVEQPAASPPPAG